MNQKKSIGKHHTQISHLKQRVAHLEKKIEQYKAQTRGLNFRIVLYAKYIDYYRTFQEKHFKTVLELEDSVFQILSIGTSEEFKAYKELGTPEELTAKLAHLDAVVDLLELDLP